MKRPFVLAALLAVCLAGSAAAQTETCQSCNITQQNIDRWRLIDANCGTPDTLNGDNLLSTSDIALISQCILNLQGSALPVFAEDLEFYFNSESNCVGMAFGADDARILQALRTYFWITGETQASLGKITRCLQLVVLGACP